MTIRLRILPRLAVVTVTGLVFGWTVTTLTSASPWRVDAWTPVAVPLRRSALTSPRSVHVVSSSSNDDDPTTPPPDAPLDRTRRIVCATVWATSTASVATSVVAAETDTASLTPVYQLPSGLKYLDLVVGDGPTPRYGQLLSIAYTAYGKLPAAARNNQPQQFDRDDGYVVKHGNGRIIPGLDEGLHGMRVGGTRRILVPPKLGYVDSGLGPMPALPWDRRKLNSILDQMVALAGGTLIFEVTLRSVMDDEADQGYYGDDSLTPEEFALLRRNLQQKARDGVVSIVPDSL